MNGEPKEAKMDNFVSTDNLQRRAFRFLRENYPNPRKGIVNADICEYEIPQCKLLDAFAEFSVSEVSRLQEELWAAQKDRDAAVRARIHTWKWITAKYGKLQDWARTRLPHNWRNEFFSCIANGLFSATEDNGKRYITKSGMEILPHAYFTMGAQEAMLHDLFERAEAAESRIQSLESELAEALKEPARAIRMIAGWFGCSDKAEGKTADEVGRYLYTSEREAHERMLEIAIKARDARIQSLTEAHRKIRDTANLVAYSSHRDYIFSVAQSALDSVTNEETR